MRELNVIKNSKTNEEENIKNLLGKIINVKIDRPIGSVHPSYKDMIYETNYGYYDEYVSCDNEFLDCYIVGESLPLEKDSTYEGKVIAIIHRLNDDEDKLVVAPINREVSKDEIITKTEFTEQYFVTDIILA
ncbi:MAG: inorganic pyrophosphatase [Clostridia bacterium]|nr:inorganic pyrophosphatase [Clostridia bacterium]